VADELISTLTLGSSRQHPEQNSFHRIHQTTAAVEETAKSHWFNVRLVASCSKFS
jgi:hypothetical protein